jgi:methyl halide transferase
MVDWNQRYLDRHTPWDRGESSPALFDWAEKTEPCEVLVPGCGRGHEVVDLAKLGFQVTALDLAPAALEALSQELKARSLEAETVVGNVLDWRPDHPVQAVYEQTCFCALEPDQWETYARQLGSWVVSGGVLVASFMQTGSEGGPPYHCDLDQMKALLSEGWRWPDTAAKKVPHPRGDIFELAVEINRL